MKFCAIGNIIRRFKFYFICSILIIIMFYLISLLSIADETPIHRKYERRKLHGLCLIVPFKDRFEELFEFAPYMVEFLSKQKIRHHIYVMNQIDSYRFNRGALINVGYKYGTTNSNCDYIAMHDVDLLPINEDISYAYPGDHAFHVASPNLHPKYHYRTFIGGILLINKKQFEVAGGLSNRYWGWGMEDDEFYLRLKNKRISIYRPGKLSTGVTDSFRHIHGPKRKRDTERCFNQAVVNMKRDRVSGVHNVEYKIQSVHELTVDNKYPVTLVNVELDCNRAVTPWCTCEMVNPFSLNPL